MCEHTLTHAHTCTHQVVEASGRLGGGGGGGLLMLMMLVCKMTS